MLCQNCSKNEVTCHFKETINSDTKEMYLCSECAASLGYDKLLTVPQFPFGFNSLFGTFLPLGQPEAPERPMGMCPLCGATIDDITKLGKLGCAECYTVFDSMLAPFIKRVHGSACHTGRIPASAADEIKTRSRLRQLREELDECIKSQEFERAAELRDEIRKLDNNGIAG